MTYTHANLDVSRGTYHEVRRLLMAAGYQHVLPGYGVGGAEVMDMHGIALRIDPADALVRVCTVYDKCCAKRPVENVHRLKHYVCERCGWNGKQGTTGAGELTNNACPKCSALAVPAAFGAAVAAGKSEKAMRTLAGRSGRPPVVPKAAEQPEAERILDEVLEAIEVEPRQITDFDSPLLCKIAEGRSVKSIAGCFKPWCGVKRPCVDCEPIHAVILKANEPTANGHVYTEEALRQLDGARVPVRFGQDGPLIGEAELDSEGNASVHIWKEAPRVCTLDAATGGPGTSDNCCFQSPGHEGLHDWEKLTGKGYTEIFAPAKLLRDAELHAGNDGTKLFEEMGAGEQAVQMRDPVPRACPDKSECKMDCVPGLCVRQLDVRICPTCNAAGDEPCKTWRGLTFQDGTRHPERDREIENCIRPSALLQSKESGAVPGTVDQSKEVRMSSVKIGDPVVFADQRGKLLNATVITVFATQVVGPDEEATWEDGTIGPTINVAFVDPDPAKTDTYGRQLKRETSVCHKGGSTAHGFWWVLPKEL